MTCQSCRGNSNRLCASCNGPKKTTFCSDCMPWSDTWISKVETIPDPFTADLNHIYQTPDNKFYVLGNNRMEMVEVGGGGGSTYDDSGVQQRLSALEKKPDKDTMYTAKAPIKIDGTVIQKDTIKTNNENLIKGVLVNDNEYLDLTPLVNVLKRTITKPNIITNYDGYFPNITSEMWHTIPDTPKYVFYYTQNLSAGAAYINFEIEFPNIKWETTSRIHSSIGGNVRNRITTLRLPKYTNNHVEQHKFEYFVFGKYLITMWVDIEPNRDSRLTMYVKRATITDLELNETKPFVLNDYSNKYEFSDGKKIKLDHTPRFIIRSLVFNNNTEGY